MQNVASKIIPTSIPLRLDTTAVVSAFYGAAIAFLIESTIRKKWKTAMNGTHS